MREDPVRAPPEPTRCDDAREREGDKNESGGEVVRLVGPHLEGREHVEQEARVVEPVRIETAAVRHLPRARDDVGLVGVQERKRQPVLDPDQADPGCPCEQGDEGEPRAAPAGFAGH
jgi:hypothetical protein